MVGEVFSPDAKALWLSRFQTSHTHLPRYVIPSYNSPPNSNRNATTSSLCPGWSVASAAMVAVSGGCTASQAPTPKALWWSHKCRCAGTPKNLW